MYGYSTGCAPSAYGYRSYGAPLALRSQSVSTGLSIDDVKAKLEEETFNVKNKYWLAGAAVVGLGWYGMSAGWFR